MLDFVAYGIARERVAEVALSALPASPRRQRHSPRKMWATVMGRLFAARRAQFS